MVVRRDFQNHDIKYRRLQLSLNCPIRNAIKSDVKLNLTDINFVCCENVM